MFFFSLITDTAPTQGGVPSTQGCAPMRFTQYKSCSDLIALVCALCWWDASLVYYDLSPKAVLSVKDSPLGRSRRVQQGTPLGLWCRRPGGNTTSSPYLWRRWRSCSWHGFRTPPHTAGRSWCPMVLWCPGGRSSHISRKGQGPRTDR